MSHNICFYNVETNRKMDFPYQTRSSETLEILNLKNKKDQIKLIETLDIEKEWIQKIKYILSDENIILISN